MEKQPKVSVIIPCRNAASTVARTLQSVLGQTLKDLEILFYDDASDDGTVEIIRSFDDGRIKIFEDKENLGPGPARNFCLDQAKGEYIAFIDADDVYAADTALEKLCQAAKGSGHPVVCGSCRIWEDRTRHYVGKQTTPMAGHISAKDYQYSYGYWRGLYERGFLQNNRLKFPAFRRYEDPVFFLETLLKAGGLFFIRDPIIDYAIGNQNYKKWSDQAVNDFCEAIFTNLKIAEAGSLPDLVKLTCYHLAEKNEIIGASFLGGNSQVYSLVEKINSWVEALGQKDIHTPLSTFLNLQAIKRLTGGDYAAYKKIKKLQTASYLDHLKAACAIDPDFLDNRLNYLRCQKTALKEKIIQETGKLKKHFPLSPAPDLEISFFREEFDSREAAVEHLREAIREYPAAFRLRERLFYLLLFSDDYAQAEPYLEYVPTYYEIPLLRMKSAWGERTGNMAAAKYYAEEALAEGWHDPWSYIWGYELFSRGGDKRQAKKILGKGLALFPLDPNLQQHFIESRDAREIIREEMRLANWTAQQERYFKGLLKQVSK